MTKKLNESEKVKPADGLVLPKFLNPKYSYDIYVYLSDGIEVQDSDGYSGVIKKYFYTLWEDSDDFEEDLETRWKDLADYFHKEVDEITQEDLDSIVKSDLDIFLSDKYEDAAYEMAMEEVARAKDATTVGEFEYYEDELARKKRDDWAYAYDNVNERRMFLKSDLDTESRKTIEEAKGKSKKKKARRKSKIKTTYTTGDIEANIKAFNKRMGTFFNNSNSTGAFPEIDFDGDGLGDESEGASDSAGSTGEGGSEGGGMGESLSLHEAKRQVRRYYIRPQNIFCASKLDIIKALIQIENENCSIYTLSKLEDNNDVNKLSSKDIIYYYDDGILYDKNRVRVMDYDLNIKHEEKRNKLDVDKVSDSRFEKEYQDRITEITEEFDDEDVFDLDFDDVDAYGNVLSEGKARQEFCCICGEPLENEGNNPDPVRESGRCCDACNMKFVIPARLASYRNED